MPFDYLFGMPIGLVLFGADPLELALVWLVATVATTLLSWDDIERWRRVQELKEQERLAAELIEPVSPTTRRNSWIIGLAIGLPIAVFFCQNLFLAIPPGVAIGYGLSRVIRRSARNRRRARLDEQTIIFIRVLNQTMLTGESTFRAIEMSLQAVPDPLRSEVQWLVSRIYTDGIVKAIEGLREQTDSPYLKHLLGVLRAAEKDNLTRSSTCGRLSRLYDAFSTIRTLQQTIKAQVAQTRYGQYLVMALVPALLAISSMINPTIARVIFTEPLGRVILALVVLDEALVFFVTSRLLAGVEFAI